MSAEDTMKEAAVTAFEGSENTKDKLRNHCMTRGYNGILALGRMFRRQDNDQSNNLSVEEFTEGINQSGLEVSEEEIAELLQEFDTDGEGSINYEEFLTAVRPDMNEDRMTVVEEAFAALDESGDGKVTLDDLMAKYNVSNHPSVLDGSETEEDILGRFISRIKDAISEDGTITKSEFLDYYSGISNSVDEDELFIEIVKKSYGL